MNSFIRFITASKLDETIELAAYLAPVAWFLW